MFRAPNSLPSLSILVDDLPDSPAAICAELEISASTWKRYLRADWAPRPIMLSLFWETRWGRSAADCNAANDATVNAQHATMLREQNARLHRIIMRLEAEREHGRHLAANGPVFLLG